MNESNNVELTSGGYKVLGNLVDLKDLVISNAIKQRGGGQSQVNQLSTEYQQFTVAELANKARKRKSRSQNSN